MRNAILSTTEVEVQSMFVVSPSLKSNFMGTIVRLAWEARLPLAGHRREWVEHQKGAVFSCAPKLAPAGAGVARYVDSILKGASRPTCPCNGWTISSW
jgi:ABC-type uncharacterized transport system substrate-binding protein